MVNGSKQTINFSSKPEGATYYAGVIKGTTPAAVDLKRNQDYFVKFEKDCFEIGFMPVGQDSLRLVLGGAVTLGSL
jgi:hypothetical protein